MNIHVFEVIQQNHLIVCVYPMNICPQFDFVCLFFKMFIMYIFNCLDRSKH